MNAYISKHIALSFTLTTGLFCVISSSMADDMTFAIKNHPPLSITFKGEHLDAISSSLSSSPTHIFANDIELKAHCREYYIVYYAVANWTEGLLFQYDILERTRSFTVDGLRTFSKEELVNHCSIYGDGGPYTIEADVELYLECMYNRMFFDPHYEEKSFTAKLPIELTCNPPDLQEEDATVQNQLFHFECPETPRKDETYWQKYRLVVEGTNARFISTHQSLGEARCIRAYLSDGSNTNKIVESWE